MNTRTFCKWVPFVVVLMLISTNGWSKSTRRGGTQEGAQVTISVYNDAGVPVDVLRQGEEEASRVFRQAGIEVQWLNCILPADGCRPIPALTSLKEPCVLFPNPFSSNPYERFPLAIYYCVYFKLREDLMSTFSRS